jgi:hypothetical protein
MRSITTIPRLVFPSRDEAELSFKNTSFRIFIVVRSIAHPREIRILVPEINTDEEFRNEFFSRVQSEKFRQLILNPDASGTSK